MTHNRKKQKPSSKRSAELNIKLHDLEESKEIKGGGIRMEERPNPLSTLGASLDSVIGAGIVGPNARIR